jgi:hypothetical protein
MARAQFYFFLALKLMRVLKLEIEKISKKKILKYEDCKTRTVKDGSNSEQTPTIDTCRKHPSIQ